MKKPVKKHASRTPEARRKRAKERRARKAAAAKAIKGRNAHANDTSNSRKTVQPEGGKNGRPVGSVKDFDAMLEARAHGRELMEVAFEIALDTSLEPHVRLAAAKFGIERGYGKPILPIVTPPKFDPIDLGISWEDGGPGMTPTEAMRLYLDFMEKPEDQRIDHTHTAERMSRAASVVREQTPAPAQITSVAPQKAPISDMPRPKERIRAPVEVDPEDLSVVAVIEPDRDKHEHRALADSRCAGCRQKWVNSL
jgi:hypothetical protein